MSKSAEAASDLLPARMLNEFVYCPRLFFYEHVEGVFVHNADTRRGAEDHKRVDGGKGELPVAKKKKAAAEEKDETSDDAVAADEPREGDDTSAADQPSTLDSRPSTDAETIHSRSVMLGSESLGIVAKLDLVEVTLEAQASETSDLAARSKGRAPPQACVRSNTKPAHRATAPRMALPISGTPIACSSACRFSCCAKTVTRATRA